MTENELMELAVEVTALTPELIRQEAFHPNWGKGGRFIYWHVVVPDELRGSWNSLSAETKLAVFIAGASVPHP